VGAISFPRGQFEVGLQAAADIVAELRAGYKAQTAK